MAEKPCGESEKEKHASNRSNNQDDNDQSLEDDSTNNSGASTPDWNLIYKKYLGVSALEDEDEELSEAVAGINVSEDDETTNKKITTSLHLFQELINDEVKITPENQDKPKVLIIHSECSSKLAESLAEKLSSHTTYNYRVATLSQIQHIFNMQTCDMRKAAITWADIIIVIIDDVWIKDTESIDVSEQRSNRSLETKYEFTVLQNVFVSKASMNVKFVPVISSGNSSHYRSIIEFGNALDINNVDQIARNVTKLRDAARKRENFVQKLLKKPNC